MSGGDREILDKISSEIYIDELESPADAEDWFSCPDKGIKDGQLSPIQPGVSGNGTASFLAEPGRMDITAPRKNKALAEGGLFRRKTYLKRNMTGKKCSFIVLGISWNASDQNFHEIHLLFLCYARKIKGLQSEETAGPYGTKSV